MFSDNLCQTSNKLLRAMSPDLELAFRKPMTVNAIRCISLSGQLVGFAVCPQCGCSLAREYQHFCDRCGQKLDWGSYDKAVVILPSKHLPAEIEL